jgi:hypothetical protein
MIRCHYLFILVLELLAAALKNDKDITLILWSLSKKLRRVLSGEFRSNLIAKSLNLLVWFQVILFWRKYSPPCPCFIAPSIFSNVYLNTKFSEINDIWWITIHVLCHKKTQITKQDTSPPTNNWMQRRIEHRLHVETVKKCLNIIHSRTTKVASFSGLSMFYCPFDIL